MKISFVLIVVIVVGLFLPQDVFAQKRPNKNAKRSASTSKKNSNRVKKTGNVKKRVVAKQPNTAPLVGTKLAEVIVVPRCNEGNDHFSVQVLDYQVLTQFIIYKDGKLQVKKSDGTFSTSQADFLNQLDYILATKLVSVLQPFEMELYPSTRTRNSTYVTNFVLINKPDQKWTSKDGAKVLEIIKVLFEPTVKVLYIGYECVDVVALPDTPIVISAAQ